MLPNVMKYNTLIKIDAISNQTSPGYDDREMSYLLNTAQDRVFLKHYNPQGNKYGVGFEYNEKRKRDLAELVTSTYIFGYDSNDIAITSGNVTYTCTTSIELPDSTTRKVTIDTIGGESSTATYLGLTSILLPLTAGLYKGQTLTFNSDAASEIETTVLDIISDTEFYVSDDLATLTTNPYFTGGLGISTNQFGKHENGYILDLPDLYLYSAEEKVITDENLTGYSTIKPITHDHYEANINNPYKKPYKNLIWRMNISKNIKGYGDEDGTYSDDILQRKQSNKRIELITDGNNPKVCLLRYLKYPRRIVVDEDTSANQISCELDESLHDEIVSEAANIAIAATQPQKYQITSNEVQQSE